MLEIRGRSSIVFVQASQEDILKQLLAGQEVPGSKLDRSRGKAVLSTIALQLQAKVLSTVGNAVQFLFVDIRYAN